MAKSLLETFENLDGATKHALADITSPRLLAFAALEIAETQCGIDRLSSEHIVAYLEMAGVAVKKLSINRSLVAATGYISSRKDEGETSYKLMTKGKREIEQALGGEKISVVRMNKNSLLNQNYICPIGADGVHRVRRGGDGVVTRSPRKKNPVTKLKLLSQLAARARER